MNASRTLVCLLAAFIAVSPELEAHSGQSLAAHDFWTAWSFEPGTILLLFLTASLYAMGARTKRGSKTSQQWFFWAGWISLALALLSPLHELGETLLSAHMIQHEVLILISAPLLVLSHPAPAMLWGLPASARFLVARFFRLQDVTGIWRFLTKPVTAWMLHATAIWIWHIPALFQQTLTNEWAHALQHLSFFLTALLFWWTVLNPMAQTRSIKSKFGVGILSIFTTTIHTGALGALLTFSKSVWYPAYANGSFAFGLTPLEDQQAAGLIMWVPGSVVYLIPALVMLARILGEETGANTLELVEPGGPYAR